MEWLQNYIIRACLISFDGTRWFGLARDQHHRDLAPVRRATDDSGKIGTGHARHVEFG